MRYADISLNMECRFEVFRRKDSHVLWLNTRWLAERGVDIHNSSIIKQICEMLISNYAVSSLPHDPKSETGDSFIMGADRYGGPEGRIHGGSGRCGSLGEFQAKGIGPTPLVPNNADWPHSHGFLPLEEAIREVIASEIAAAELPMNSIPIIAILDAGVFLPLGSGNRLVKCAIILRPCFLRVAHLERSIYFGSSGYDESDQHIDSKKTYDVLKYIINHEIVPGSKNHILKNIMSLACMQIGACRANRFWPGRASSDNMTIDGKIVEYGSYRTLPNWKRVSDGQGSHFGVEENQITRYVNAIPKLIKRHFGIDQSIHYAKDAELFIHSAIQSSFKIHCLSGCNIAQHTDSGELFSNIAKEYFDAQQHVIYSLNSPNARFERRDWFHFDESNLHTCNSIRGDKPYSLFEICRKISKETQISIIDVRRNMMRWTKPRPLQYYHIAKYLSQKICNSLNSNIDSNKLIISNFISLQISLNRRIFNLEHGCSAVFFSADCVSTALCTANCVTNQVFVKLSGIALNGNVTLFGKRFKIPRHLETEDGRYVHFNVPIHQDPYRVRQISVMGVNLDISKNMVVF